jgi:hypothetical protein
MSRHNLGKKNMNKRMTTDVNGKLVPIGHDILKDFSAWGGTIFTVKYKNNFVDCKVIKTVKNDYHLVITKDNIVIDVDWNENSESVNNIIFNDYDFTSKTKEVNYA